MRSAILLVLSAFVAVAARSGVEARPRPPLPETQVPLPGELAVAALSFDSIAADLFWIRFIQALPSRTADERLGSHLATQLRSVVELDPNFTSAYTSGTLLLNVIGDRPCEALRILDEGIRRKPADWRIRFQAGFLCYNELSDAACAAKHLRAAAASPDAPGWLPGLVGRLLAEASQVDAAIAYLSFELERATDPRLRARFAERLQEALLTKQIEHVEGALREWRLQHGGLLPASLGTLVLDGFLTSLPESDPFGGHLELGSDGRVRSSSGHGGLRAFRQNLPFRGTLGEKLTAQRVLGRIAPLLDRASAPHSPIDRAFAFTGQIEGIARALVRMDQIDPDPARAAERLGLEARLLLRVESDRLRAAHLRLLKRDAGARWSIAEIAAEAGVPRHDPFGDPYNLDAAGRPVPGQGRRPLTAVLEQRGAARPCR